MLLSIPLKMNLKDQLDLFDSLGLVPLSSSDKKYLIESKIQFNYDEFITADELHILTKKIEELEEDVRNNIIIKIIS